MKSALFGILNWKRTSKGMKKIPHKLMGDVVVCTDNPEFWKGYETLEAVESIAASKNKIIDLAIQRGYEFVFIVEDDVLPDRKEDFSEYMCIMRKYDLNIMMYGYDNKNSVLDEKPNPSLIVNDGRGRELHINRYPCSSMIALRVRPDMVKFNEELVAIETDVLAYDMAEHGQYPFKGFFFDIAESWKKFHKVLGDDRSPLRRVRPEITPDLINKDKKTRGLENFVLENSADKVLEYIKVHRNNQ